MFQYTPKRGVLAPQAFGNRGEKTFAPFFLPSMLGLALAQRLLPAQYGLFFLQPLGQCGALLGHYLWLGAL